MNVLPLILAVLEIFPSRGILNPYKPTYAAPEPGFRGDVIPFNGVEVGYRLAPYVTVTEKTHVRFAARAGKWIERYDLFTLRGAMRSNPAVTGELVLVVSSAKTGRAARWEWRENKRVTRSQPMGLTIADAWVEIEAPHDFAFDVREFSVSSGLVDELTMNDPAFSLALDWEGRSYAARVTVKSGTGARGTRFLGFGCYACSLDPERRDCPRIQLTNAGATPWRQTLDCVAWNEVTGRRLAWKQEVVCPSGASVCETFRFPEPLATGLWHLTVNGGEPQNFVYVRRRDEPAGDRKFGFHHVTQRGIGGCMDALAVPIQVRYLHWPCIVAPPWVEDFMKRDPQLDPSCWNWNYGCEIPYREGHDLILCIQTVPMADWQRVPNTSAFLTTGEPWTRGGLAKAEAYTSFVRECAKRYGDRVLAWEVENEPNAYLLPKDAKYYPAICKMVYEGVKSVTPKTPVYGISGTANFVPWMEEALDAGCAKWLDGPSWHTYTTPHWPDKAGIGAMIETAIERFGGKAGINTETGVCTVRRYTLTNAIPKDVVLDNRERRTTGFVTPGAFPGPGLDEWSAAASFVRNATVNFWSGAKLFTFFGGVGPQKFDWTKTGRSDFYLRANDPQGKDGPSLVTLGVGVLAAELEPATLANVRHVSGVFGVEGAVFEKASGGRTAVLWSSAVRAEAIVRTDEREIEVVDVLGRSRIVKADRGTTFVLKLTESPIYVHTRKGVLDVIANPVVSVETVPSADGGEVQFKFANRETRTHAFRLVAGQSPVVSFSPCRLERKLSPNSYDRGSLRYTFRGEAPATFELAFTLEMEDGARLAFRIPVRQLNGLRVSRTPGGNLSAVPPLRLDRDEQVVLGHAPKNASLQESRYWEGPAELSARVRTGYDEKAFYVRLDVTDSVRQLPKGIGIGGSSVELFVDFRPPERGLGSGSYGKRVYQFVIVPALTNDQTLVWSPQIGAFGAPANRHIRATSRPTENGYVMDVAIPWALAERGEDPVDVFGFDVGVNGAVRGKADVRKTQMMLFGAANNNTSAALFGRAKLAK